MGVLPTGVYYNNFQCLFFGILNVEVCCSILNSDGESFFICMCDNIKSGKHNTYRW